MCEVVQCVNICNELLPLFQNTHADLNMHCNYMHSLDSSEKN